MYGIFVSQFKEEEKKDDISFPKDRIPKLKKKQYTAIKTLFPRINVEDELCFSIPCCSFRL